MTVCYAQQGNKQVTLAVLDHAFQEPYVNKADLFRVVEPRVWLYLFLVITLMAFATFFGAAMLLVFWVPLFVAYAVSRVKHTFTKSGLDTLWRVSWNDAVPLMS